MFDALVMTAALALPADGSSSRHQQSSHSQSARWMDSGAAVWNHTPVWIRNLSLCIRKHESIRAGHYRANNRSGASGAYQFMPSTWRGNALYTPGARKYAYGRPSSAPAAVQDAVFIHAIQHGGIHAWHGTWCSGT
jgi:hypothetical protein